MKKKKGNIRCALGFHSTTRVRNKNVERALTVRGLTPRQYLDNYSTTICSRCGMRYIPPSMSVSGKAMWIEDHKVTE